MSCTRIRYTIDDSSARGPGCRATRKANSRHRLCTHQAATKQADPHCKRTHLRSALFFLSTRCGLCCPQLFSLPLSAAPLRKRGGPISDARKRHIVSTAIGVQSYISCCGVLFYRASKGARRCPRRRYFACVRPTFVVSPATTYRGQRRDFSCAAPILYSRSYSSTIPSLCAAPPLYAARPRW